jgi:hypothetical protein
VHTWAVKTLSHTFHSTVWIEITFTTYTHGSFAAPLKAAALKKKVIERPAYYPSINQYKWQNLICFCSEYVKDYRKEALLVLRLNTQGNKRTKKWFKRLKRLHGPEGLDGKLLRSGKAERQIKHCIHWHDKLIELEIEFDKSRPSTSAQWGEDRRDVSQWYPLRVAIALTVLLGLIRSIEGALQVYKAYNP